MTSIEREAFENPEASPGCPEVGSRAMQRLLVVGDQGYNPWVDVQGGRYRFHASIHDGITIRIVLHETIACQVDWLSS